MQKIMFDDRFGLTAAVYEGWKNMTRRPARKKYIKDANGNLSWKGEYLPPIYKVGDIVAVAQKYKDIIPYLADSLRQPSPNYMMDKPGYNNKMFVRADLMPTRIRITAWRRERLQEISDEDCLREGVFLDETAPTCYQPFYTFPGSIDHDTQVGYKTPREAFADLIQKMSGKRTWDDNPYEDVYDFELEK